MKTEGPPPDWDALYETAAAQAGYFTLGDAIAAGFSAPLLQYHCGGRIERAGRGIFRLRHYPVMEQEDLVPIWLWAGKAGVFSHETALQLHGLSDVLPAHHYLTVPASWRRRRLRVPPGVTLAFRDYEQGEVEWHGPVPVTSPLRTLLDSLEAHVLPDLWEAALHQAVERGLVARSEAESLRKRAASS
ncbi:MAG: hypothetical protein ACLGIN_15255 [Candidatus Sericytochromatia bacterium]